MSRDELTLLLKEHKQEHLLSYYNKLSQEDKDFLATQIKEVDWKLIDLALGQHQHPRKGILEPLEGMSVRQIAANRSTYYDKGIHALQTGKVAVVLLAGGQGTRLGCDGPKGTVNIGITRELYIFEMLFHNILEVVKQANAWIPFYIMTSDKNNEETITFLKQHDFFGYPTEYVTFYTQDMTPSVNYEGKLFMETPKHLSLSPNGNGGWFSSLVNAGLLKNIKQKNIEWLNVFSVDNVLQKIADPIFIGATIAMNNQCGAKVVRKANPLERVGVLCLEDGKPSIVEYYEMTEEMIHKRNREGELSYSYGVILNYLFRVDQLLTILNLELPIHVVEKKIPYLNEVGQYIVPDKPNGYKFEELVLDMIHLFDNCLPFEVIREEEFAPIKNAVGVDSIDSARELLVRNGYIL